MSTTDLPSLPTGVLAAITSVQAEELLGQRLQALGFRVGQPISIVRRSWWSGPLHVRLGTTELIVRRRDAQAIQVQHGN
jgi:ferrous iron transport protein A